jgi:hypothetical protein
VYYPAIFKELLQARLHCGQDKRRRESTSGAAGSIWIKSASSTMNVPAIMATLGALGPVGISSGAPTPDLAGLYRSLDLRKYGRTAAVIVTGLASCSYSTRLGLTDLLAAPPGSPAWDRHSAGTDSAAAGGLNEIKFYELSCRLALLRLWACPDGHLTCGNIHCNRNRPEGG